MPTIRRSQRLEKGRETSDPTEPSPEAQNHVPHPRRGRAETSRPAQNATPNRTTLLVARYESLGNEIREELRTMPPQPNDRQNHLPIDHLPALKDSRSAGTTPHYIERMDLPALDQQRNRRRTGRLAEGRTPGDSPR